MRATSRYALAALTAVVAPVWVKAAVGPVGETVIGVGSFSLLAGALAGAPVPSLLLPRPIVAAVILAVFCSGLSAVAVPDDGIRRPLEALTAFGSAGAGFALAFSSVSHRMPLVNRVAIISCFWLAPAILLIFRLMAA